MTVDAIKLADLRSMGPVFRLGITPHPDFGEQRVQGPHNLIRGEAIGLPSKPSHPADTGKSGTDERETEKLPHKRSGGQNEGIKPAPTAVVESDHAAGLGNAHRLSTQLESVVVVAMLQRDVAEREIDAIGGEIECLPIDDTQRLEAFDAAKAPDRFKTPFKKPGIEVARDDAAELAGECTRHTPDPAADLDERRVFGALRSEAEDRKVRPSFGVTGGDKLFKCEVVACLVVKHPPRAPDHVVTRRLFFRHSAGRPPRHELTTTTHPRIMPTQWQFRPGLQRRNVSRSLSDRSVA